MGLTVSFDPNWRSTLWSFETARDVLSKYLPYVDVLIGIEPIHVYREDGTLNLQESYWHYEDSDDLYRSIISTPEFKQAINGYRSVTIRYPKTEGKITAKLQQWIVGYPDGSEYNFLFDGTKYCRMPIWSD